MNEYIAALLLGFSFGNLWLCAILVLTLQVANRSTCGGYLVGRFIAICALCAAVSALGRFVSLDRSVLNLVSGLLLIGFSLYLAATRIFNWQLPGTKPHVHEGESPAHCSGSCKICVSEEPEYEALTRQARLKFHKRVEGRTMAGFGVGLSLGAVRGASMCGKLVVLTPMLLSAPVGKGVMLGAVFSLASSIYPLLGFTLGAFAVKLLDYKRILFAVSCLFLGVIGFKYLFMAF